MNHAKIDILMPALAVTLSAGLCLAWLIGWTAGDASWSLRMAYLAGGLALVAGAVWFWVRALQRSRRNVIQYLNNLCRISAQAEHGALSETDLPPLQNNPAWRGAADAVRGALLRLHARLEEVQQTHTLLEVRCRRAVAEVEQVRRILSGLSDPIFAINDYDEIVLVNRSAEELFGMDLEKAETRAMTQLIRCEKLVQLLTGVRQRKTAAHRAEEVEIADARGQTHYYRATAAKLAIKGASSNQVTVAEGAVVVLRDIGDQRALQKRNAEFVSSVSHEMKTPLAGIKAYVELLADGDAEDEQTREEFLQVINGQTDRLQRLVDNLLNLARIEAGVISVNKQHRSLNEILDEALHVVQPSAEAKNIELVSELSPLYLGVLADRDTMLQAAINLLSNAIKYTPGGGKVTLRSRLCDDQVRFEVQDNGVGLSEDDCRRVFEKFYRVKKDKDMASGTGLGLPLAKHIVEDVHGGKLTVESTLGKGSTFIVTLPCAGQMMGE